MSRFDWLCDDVTRLIADQLDDVDVWNIRMVSKRFGHIEKTTGREYELLPFLAHPDLLNAMTPHKRMWRQARNELLQKALLRSLDDPTRLLTHATQDVHDVLCDERNPDGIRDLTLYDLCVIDDEGVLSRMLSCHVPVVRYMIRHANIPRTQRAMVPCTSDPLPIRFPFSQASYQELLRTCSRLHHARPLQGFLDLHDKYFAFHFHDTTQRLPFDARCKEATAADPLLFSLASRRTSMLSTD